MSATNWNTCPFCLEEKRKKATELEAQVSESYGVLPIEEWDALRELAAAQRLKADLFFPSPKSDGVCTLREDYEYWIDYDTGVVNTKYEAGCTVCGAYAEFKPDTFPVLLNNLTLQELQESP